MYVDANGIRINYRLDGWQGSPWVTFITGIANDTTMWDGQIPALEDEFNILRLDTAATAARKQQTATTRSTC